MSEGGKESFDLGLVILIFIGRLGRRRKRETWWGRNVSLNLVGENDMVRNWGVRNGTKCAGNNLYKRILVL